jgi:hypothetical protein
LSKKSRLKRIAVSVLKHTHSNTAAYATMIGAVSQEDYLSALSSFGLIILRAAIGAVQRRLEKSKEKDDQTKP